MNKISLQWGLEEAVLSLYECTDCGMQWCSLWDCGCDDPCPECEIDYSPYKVIFVQDLNDR